jgi:hypothetical protein
MSGVSVEEVDGHMNQWSSAGWQLVSASTVTHREGDKSYLVHCFYWRFAEDNAASTGLATHSRT